MVIFWRLILAHLLTDYTFQSNKIAIWKRKNAVGVLVHSLIFLVISTILTWKYIFETWVRFPGWACILLLFVIHFVEDYYRETSIKKSDVSDSIIFFTWDQFIHFLIVYLVSPVNKGVVFEEKTIILLILAVVVTHFSSILVYYIEQFFLGKVDAALRLKNKYYLIVERFLVFVLLILPGAWAALAVVLWVFSRILQKKMKISFTAINIVASTVITLSAGLAGRLILY